MARHNRRRRPRNRVERELAEQRESQLIAQLTSQAQETRQLQALANDAQTKLKRCAIKLAQDRELDITDIAAASGISRQMIHALLRSDKARTAQPPVHPHGLFSFEVGGRVIHRSQGAGTIERADGDAVLIRFDSKPEAAIEMHGRLAGLKVVVPDLEVS